MEQELNKTNTQELFLKSTFETVWTIGTSAAAAGVLIL